MSNQEIEQTVLNKGYSFQVTKRELKEIRLALYYEKMGGHGTAGHNRLILMSKLAGSVGIELAGDNASLVNNESYLTVD